MIKASSSFFASRMPFVSEDKDMQSVRIIKRKASVQQLTLMDAGVFLFFSLFFYLGQAGWIIVTIHGTDLVSMLSDNTLPQATSCRKGIIGHKLCF